jgi:hypothetical protein
MDRDAAPASGMKRPILAVRLFKRTVPTASSCHGGGREGLGASGGAPGRG